MKRRLRSLCTYFLVLVLLLTTALPALAEGAGTVVYRDTEALADGLDCQNEIAWHSQAGRQESWSLIYSLSADVHPVVAWGESIREKATLTTAADLAEEAGLRVLAGFNTDFFDMVTGCPMGMIVSGGILFSSDAGRAAIGFTETGKAVVGYPALTLAATNQGSAENTANMGKSFTVSHYNKEPNQWVLDLISRDYAESLDLTGTWYIAEVETLAGAMTLGGSITLRVDRLLTVADETYTIPTDRMILIASAEGYFASSFLYLAENDELALEIQVGDSRFCDVTEACGGGDILVADGTITDSAAWTSSVASRNPRTAVGIREDGTMLFYVADGRVSGHSGGLTLTELAEELLDRGCTTVLNLDGGGSTTLACQSIGEDTAVVINRPCDGSLRKCAVFLLLAANDSPDGKAAHLALENAGALVLTDSSLELGEILASDRGYAPTETPADTRVWVLAGQGIVKDGIYYSGGESGGVTLALCSELAGAQGQSMLHVLSDVSQITLTEGDTLLVGEGDSLTVTPQASYYGRAVAGDNTAYTYALAGNLGTVSENGTLSVDTLTAEQAGTLTVSYGTAREEVSVNVYCRFADTEGHWAEDYIDQMSKTGVVKGSVQEDTRYYLPEDTVTCQELCVMMARLLGLDSEAAGEVELPYADIEKIGSWALGSVQALYEKGILLTQPAQDGLTYLNPTQPLDRQSVCAMLARALGLEQTTEEAQTTLARFADSAGVSDWAKPGTAALVSLGLVEGYPDGTLRPSDSVTRAQTAKLLCSLIAS